MEGLVSCSSSGIPEYLLGSEVWEAQAVLAPSELGLWSQWALIPILPSLRPQWCCFQSGKEWMESSLGPSLEILNFHFHTGWVPIPLPDHKRVKCMAEFALTCTNLHSWVSEKTSLQRVTYRMKSCISKQELLCCLGDCFSIYEAIYLLSRPCEQAVRATKDDIICSSSTQKPAPYKTGKRSWFLFYSVCCRHLKNSNFLWYWISFVFLQWV